MSGVHSSWRRAFPSRPRSMRSRWVERFSRAIFSCASFAECYRMGEMAIFEKGVRVMRGSPPSACGRRRSAALRDQRSAFRKTGLSRPVFRAVCPSGRSAQLLLRRGYGGAGELYGVVRPAARVRPCRNVLPHRGGVHDDRALSGRQVHSTSLQISCFPCRRSLVPFHAQCAFSR